MKKSTIVILLILIFISNACYDKNIDNLKPQNTNNTVKESENKMSKIKVTINSEIYELNLENNDTAKEFVEKLPQEFTMRELNNNEKYFYMDFTLSANPIKPPEIKKGDVMLYGDNCLVIFYKTFKTNYTYTKIGHIDNFPDLGNYDTVVKFE